MLPTTSDYDDKHAKYRRLLCWKSSRWCIATIGRTILLFLIPILIFFHSRILRVDNISNDIAMIFWSAGIGFLSWLLERGRVRLIRKKIITRVPFIFLLLLTYLFQLIILVSTHVKDLNGSSSSGWTIIESAQRRMRGRSGIINETLQSTVIREQLLPWNQLVKQVNVNQLESMTEDEIILLHEKHHQSGIISIILVSHNEHQYTKRTLDSILNSTTPGLLQEIILVDDCSFPSIDTSYDANLYRFPLIKYYRNAKREGLIRSKIVGGKLALGNVIVFLDAHVKPDPGWAVPILRHINANYKRVVVPKIAVMNGTTWEVNREAVGEKMMFDWDLSFSWFKNNDNWVPCMSGGLLAISKRWWFESGELDPGMHLWGAENIEQSLRIWLCGGEIVVAHDSVIAHVFRPRFPYEIDSEKVMYNKLRTVEVWFDEYKDLFYNSTGHSAIKYKPKIPIPMSGHGTLVDNQVDSSVPFVNISQRLELRERLQCKPFSWYVKRFSDVFHDRLMLAFSAFSIRNPATNRCLVPHKIDGLSTVLHIALVPCDTNDMSQKWTLRYDSSAIENIQFPSCFDATISKMPSQWRFQHMHTDPHPSKSANRLHHYFELFACQTKNVNQAGWKFENNRLTFGSFCVESDPIVLDVPKNPPRIYLTSCNSKSRDDHTPFSNQNFIITDEIFIQPTQAKAIRSLGTSNPV